MGFFFSKTWPWWLLFAILAALLALLLCWFLKRRISGVTPATAGGDDRQRKREIEAARAQVSQHATRIAELEGERDQLKSRVAELEAASVPSETTPENVAAVPFAAGAVEGTPAAPEVAAPLKEEPALSETSAAPDVAAGAAALGVKLKLDDLTVVEGIGPKIQELLNGGGITTWRQLSQAEVTTLRSILENAGPRFQMHDPTTWPQQAGLLADGSWDEFKSLTERLSGGRTV
ncbi:MAG: hypothetical protein ACRCTR_00155 [Actinomycetota bacterium]